MFKGTLACARSGRTGPRPHPIEAKYICSPFWVFSLLAFLTLTFTTTTAASDEFKSLFDHATVLYDQGSYEQALKFFKKANSRKRHDAECLWYMALTFNKLGQCTEALKTSDLLIKLSYTDPLSRAKALNLRGNTLLSTDMDDPEGLKEKRLGDAVRAFREALQANPELNAAHYNLGLTLIRMNQMDEGLQELRRYSKGTCEPEMAERARLILEHPTIPAPDLELMSCIRMDFPDGYRIKLVLAIKNWASYPRELFQPSKYIPPCSVGAPVGPRPPAGTRLEFRVLGDQLPDFPIMCNAGTYTPEGFQKIEVSSALVYRGAGSRVPRMKKIYFRIKDRLTGNLVLSDGIELPKY